MRNSYDFSLSTCKQTSLDTHKQRLIIRRIKPYLLLVITKIAANINNMYVNLFLEETDILNNKNIFQTFKNYV